MYKKQIIIAIIIALGIIGSFSAILLGNNSGPSNTKAMAMSAVATNHIDIKNYMFSPMMVTVKVGTTVTWTNQDAVKHTITADTTSSKAPNSMDIAQGQSFSFKFTQAGSYTYHCFPHPYMHGTIVVTE
ncbi:MAG TPA: plastocyanin/azurin family copper-binding protein [Candidatus Microsaccharimonas sp.]|nr:plastocyanin/azurin family copper-binding protein [Candidatus Microsaccharimonas sp.]